ncbi:hypothetical protein RHMOL_Rhmol11G0193600 [Rhododendron molle]|uniref:Uncharacterized protein n=1 Tax=Rhododendron molle TaxID=49168 RepID=A0ACC0LU89_RHOML|nr:hypothetical protein RHMOL_Rhmol11G0193600 [Rhododendron molle]
MPVPDVRAAVVDRRAGGIVGGERSGGARGDDAFAAAGEKVGIADFSEGISVVDVDGGVGGSSGGYQESENEAAGGQTHAGRIAILERERIGELDGAVTDNRSVRV